MKINPENIYGVIMDITVCFRGAFSGEITAVTGADAGVPCPRAVYPDEAEAGVIDQSITCERLFFRRCSLNLPAGCIGFHGEIGA